MLSMEKGSFLCALTIASGALAQQVLVVDDSGGAPFTTIQSAVDAASSGDTVLVRTGQYGAVTIVGTGIALVADESSEVSVDSLKVQGTPANSTVLIDGIGWNAATQVASVLTEFTGCDGEVWVQNCTFRHPDGFGIVPTHTRIEQCTSVTMIGTECVAEQGLFGGSAPGLVVTNSTLFAFESLFQGVTTSGVTSPVGGIDAENSTIYLQGATTIGPNAAIGGQGHGFWDCTGVGGDAVIARGSTHVIDLNSSHQPGLGITAGWPCTTSTLAGQAIRLLGSSTHTPLPGNAMRLAMPTVRRAGNPLDFVIHGDPGDLLAIAFSLNPMPFYFPLTNAPLLVGAGFTGIPLGAIPPSGTAIAPTSVPNFPIGVELERYYVQPIALRASGNLIAGAGAALTLLSSSF